MASLLVTGGFEAGGRVGVLVPGSGLENSHASAALLGLNLCYAIGPSRLSLDYCYTGLPAKQASPYRFDVHELALGYGHEFVVGRPAAGSTSGWGVEASAAAGFGLLDRTHASAGEGGKAPASHLGAGLFQRQGHSRVSLGLDNIVFIESQPNGSTRAFALTYLIALKAGVTYVF